MNSTPNLHSFPLFLIKKIGVRERPLDETTEDGPTARRQSTGGKDVTRDLTGWPGVPQEYDSLASDESIEENDNGRSQRSVRV
jgi:hypothetical protein